MVDNRLFIHQKFATKLVSSCQVTKLQGTNYCCFRLFYSAVFDQSSQFCTLLNITCHMAFKRKISSDCAYYCLGAVSSNVHNRNCNSQATTIWRRPPSYEYLPAFPTRDTLLGTQCVIESGRSLRAIFRGTVINRESPTMMTSNLSGSKRSLIIPKYVFETYNDKRWLSRQKRWCPHQGMCAATQFLDGEYKFWARKIDMAGQLGNQFLHCFAAIRHHRFSAKLNRGMWSVSNAQSSISPSDLGKYVDKSVSRRMPAQTGRISVIWNT